MFPIYTTEKVGFRRLVETLDPRYEMPSAKYFSNTAILALFEKTRERVVAEVPGIIHPLQICGRAQRWNHT